MVATHEGHTGGLGAEREEEELPEAVDLHGWIQWGGILGNFQIMFWVSTMGWGRERERERRQSESVE